MAKIYETTMTLRFFGDDLDPDEITARLAYPPTVGAKKGGVWITKGGIEKVARTGVWRLKVKDRKPGDLNGQIAELLMLLSDDLSVWGDLTARFEADLFCGIFMIEGNEGTSMSAKTMTNLGSRNLRLEFDIYDPTLPD